MTQGEMFSDLALEQQYDNMIKALDMKQETLEEAAEKYFPSAKKMGGEIYCTYKGFIAGAKWQEQNSYSVEEVLEIIRQYALEEHLITSSKPDIWFEQFKKK
jgi:hypothetical protein